MVQFRRITSRQLKKVFRNAVLKGPLAAYPVVGVKAVLYDGSYHPVDSSEMAFKTAAIQAFKKGFMEASPVLLEPIVSMKVTVPDKYTGDVMGDLNKTTRSCARHESWTGRRKAPSLRQMFRCLKSMVIPQSFVP